MITTSINIDLHLAEYIRGKYNSLSKPVEFNDTDDLYHLIWQLMNRRPINASAIDRGNLVIALPNRRVGKDPVYFNYLSPRSQKMIRKRISQLFSLELHQMLDENAIKGYPDRNIDVVNNFMCAYSIESITEDALLKNYYRWRERERKKIKRDYVKKSDKNHLHNYAFCP
jgi:hypothetical protein